ncbi:MAG: transporter substrate-binding domain-containing protein, partial [Candidatus Poribacteria bacterium]|nr:transporter substrate-binding domain-containing protein [Candidatus Poribacteria bacterium]
FAIFLTSNTIIEAAIKNGIPVHKVGQPVFAENLAVAFDKNSFKDNTRLVKKVSKIIIDMHKDETLSTFSIKWFKEDRTKDPSI